MTKKAPILIRSAVLMAMLLSWLPPGLPAQDPVPKPNETLASLQTLLSNRVSQPHLGAATLGVKVVSLDTGNIIFTHNANKLLKPASNAKLYTGALALDRLGPDYRVKTSLYSAAKPTADGTLDGDLILRGDPTRAYKYMYPLVVESNGTFAAVSEEQIREARRMVEELEIGRAHV